MTTPSSTLPVAVQLYTLRTLPDDIGTVLGKVAEIGYPAVETIGDHGLSADALRGLLDKNGLQVISSHLQLERLQDDLPAVVEFNKAVGNTTLVAPFIPQLPQERSKDGYIQVGQTLGKIAQNCRAAGMRFLYHNHNWELREIDGKTGLEWLVDAAGDALDLELDLAWVAAAGLDPADVLKQYSGRCIRVHAKDLAKPGERPEDALMDGVVMADVGSGVLDWPNLIPAARDAGAEWYIVEHDNPRDPLASIANSFAYLSKAIPAALK